MRVGLKVNTVFSQGRDKATGERRTYREGTFIPEEHHQDWQAETLAARLQNGFVTWEPIDETPEEKEPSLAELDKAGLILYAEERYDLKLDKRGSVETMRLQIQAAEERRTLLATREAARIASAPKAPAARPSIFGNRAPSAPAELVPPSATNQTPDGTGTPAAEDEGEGAEGNDGGTNDGPPSTGTGSGDTGSTSSASTASVTKETSTAGGTEPPAT